MLELQKLPRLSILEEILISLQIPFGYLIKLRQMDGVSQRALKGHIITFRTDAADGVAAMDDKYQRHMQLPHASESVLNCIKASFIGPEGHADYLKALGLDDGPLRCDLDKMMDWLEVLKAVHSGYKDVQLRGKTDENRAMFSEMPNKIINVAQRVHSETCRAMEATVGADVAGVRDYRQSAASMPEPQEQDDGMVVDMDDPQAMTKLNLYFQTCAILDAVQSDNDAQEASILTQLQRLIDGPNGAEDKEGDEEDTGAQWEAGTLAESRQGARLCQRVATMRMVSTQCWPGSFQPVPSSAPLVLQRERKARCPSRSPNTCSCTHRALSGGTAGFLSCSSTCCSATLWLGRRTCASRANRMWWSASCPSAIIPSSYRSCVRQNRIPSPSKDARC